MDYTTVFGALALEVAAFNTALEKTEGIKLSGPSVTVQPIVQPPLHTPSLTMESIFTLRLPDSSYNQSMSSTEKSEKHHTSFPKMHKTLDVRTRVNKKSSRYVWKATAQLQTRVFEELYTARLAARLATPHIVPFRAIPYGPTTSVLESSAENESASPFSGIVCIREPVAAVSFALEEYETSRVGAENRLTLWVDASVGKGKNEVVGLAVVHKSSRDAKDWATQGYTIHEKLPNYHAECLAIAQALHDASHLVDGTPKPGSAVVVYSDCQFALKSILNFDITSRRSGHEICRTIMMLARGLRNRGIGVCLHWVPSHHHVPGNELADWVAKLATMTDKEDGEEKKGTVSQMCC